MLKLIVLLLIFVPLYPKFPLLGVSGTFVAIRLEDILVAAVFGVWFLWQLRHLFADLKLPVTTSIVIYLLIGCVSLFSAVFLTKTVMPQLGFLHTFRRFEYMLLFPVAYSFLKHLSQLDFIVRGLLLVAFLVALYGLGQQFLAWPVISTTNSEFSKGLALSLGPGARINSTFAGHYDLAAYSIFPLLLILGLLFIPVKNKWVLWAIGFVVYWTMLLSASRVTFAAFYVTAGLFILAFRKPLYLIPLFIIAVVSILASPQLLGRYQELITTHLKFSWVTPVEAAVDQDVPDALKPTDQPEDRSFNIRINVEWPKALRSFYKNPLLGTGFSSIGLASDNDYLRALAETGLLGLISFLLIIYRIFRTAWPYLSAPASTLPQVFVLAITFSLVGLLINALFIDVFEASKVAIVSWLLLGLSEKVKTLV